MNKSNSYIESVAIKLRKEYPVGSRVKLVKMDDKQAPPVGTLGTVRGVDDLASLLMTWDNGSSLNILYGVDEVIPVFTKHFRIFGKDGRHQALSFEPSEKYDWSIDNNTRIVEIQAADILATNDYVNIIITCDSKEACLNELIGQLSDGMFENIPYGKVLDLDDNEVLLL